MTDLHGRKLPPAGAADTGVHYRRVHDAIPAAIKNAPLSRLQALPVSGAPAPAWYSAARAIDRQLLTQVIDERWRLQGMLEQTQGEWQHDIEAFAEPLLKTMMDSHFGPLANLDQLTVQLEIPSPLSVGIDTGASRVRQSSLLHAALHNFEAAETVDGAFRSSSGIYRRDERGALSLEPAIALSPFATLCRELDIGGQYQKHLKSILLPESAKAQKTLRQAAVASEQAAFHLAALIARLKGDISDHAYGALKGVRESKVGVTLYDQPLLAHHLSLMGVRLSGIVLFSAVVEPAQIKAEIGGLTPALLRFWIDWSQRIPLLRGQEYDQYKLLQAFFANGAQGLSDELLRRQDIYQQSRLAGPLIAYVPEDPEHPLKEYPSLTAFMQALLGQLRTADYQAFFSRFVAQKDKGVFFKRVNERLTTVTWREREPLDMGPWWRETAAENAAAEPITVAITGDLWLALFRERRDKAIADARLIAVPTDDEDANARFKRLTGYVSIGWNLFNFATMWVPGLGEAMLGIMVAQMLAEVAEGVEDWSKGDKDEASAYFNGVLINFAQLALMGAGHGLPGGSIAPLKVSPFVERLKPVDVAGKVRLWNPDLRPYEHAVTLPQEAKANAQGLYPHQGRDLLRLDDKCFAVQQDPLTGEHRMLHPSRPDAFQPLLEHNGAGSWKTELDRPLEWDKRLLLRRLGARVDGLSDATLAQILTASGVDETLLRRLHVEHDLPPALLTDTLERFKADADASVCAERIQASRIDAEWADYAVRVMTQMRGWPADRAIEVFEGPGLTGKSIKEGYSDAAPDSTLQLTWPDLLAGKLPERVLGFLDEHAQRELLGDWFSGDVPKRTEALRDQWAEQFLVRKSQLFELLYQRRTRSDKPLVSLLKNDFAQISTHQAEALLKEAQPSDLRHLREKKRVPLRLAASAAEAAEQLRLTRAYEGLYLDAVYSADTARLQVHSLAALPGWPGDLRLEIRDYSFDGALADSLGPADAAIRKVLVRDETGQYEARDASDRHLHGQSDLYASVLHALPDAQRVALGFDINDAQRLAQAIRARPLERSLLAPILRDNPNYKPAFDPVTMRLRGGMQGYAQQAPHSAGLQRRVQALYPAFTAQEGETLLAQLTADGSTAHDGLAALEAEYMQMDRTLKSWVKSPMQGGRLTSQGESEWLARTQLCKVIRQCWQRTGPEELPLANVMRPQALKLEDIAQMGRLLETFPKLEANFDHVTSLSLRGLGLQAKHMHFLDSFKQLRYLSLQDNRLATLPQVVTDMRHLTQLFLNDNHIELDAAAVGALKRMTRLTSLGLRGNPLKLMPDISRMPYLQIVLLDGTGLETWPTGLFAQSRPRSIYLDLSRNPLRRIPDVAPGSFRAELLARSVVSRHPQWMPPDVLEKLKFYAESLGMDPERPYPPRGTLDSVDWSQGMSEKQWQERQSIWNAVEDEFDSVPFFNELRKLTQSADFRAGGTYQTELTAKVWRMLDAMSRNDELRIKLFNEAATPTECVDGGTQLFNAMGVQVLIHEAYALARADLIEKNLLELALGKSRLDELGAIARQRVAARLANGERFRRIDALGQVVGEIDEVEVHLAYMTDLAGRLNLPWQARGMQFRKIAGVSQEMIEAAYQRIKALEEGDLLTERILEQPLWRTWLESTYRDELEGLKKRIVSALDLQEALQRRVDSTRLTPQETAGVEAQIKALCRELGKPESDFPLGEPMTDAQYDQTLKDIDRQITAQMKTLTREAAVRARLESLRVGAQPPSR